MSRSRKKVGVLKDKGYGKVLYNRKFRRVNKHRLQTGKAPLLLSEAVNDYLICDYILRYSPPSADVRNERTAQKLRLAYFGK